MSYVLPSPLPLFDRRLLRAVERLVPQAERDEWMRTWQAELWHMHDRSRNRRGKGFGVTADLSIGLTRDALWLRTESWRRALDGTPTLCLASAAGLCMLAAVLAIALNGSWRSLGIYLGYQFQRSVYEAPLVVFVAFATASRRHAEQGSSGRKASWVKRQVFLFSKITLVLLLNFLLSADVCHPIRTLLPLSADLLQIFFFVFFALVGLRWAFHDQEQRCKQCLHSLATPARVGRPSHNLLEWNGTELVCKQGHGLLSVPEMETSWCQSSRWVQASGWDRAISG